MKGDNEEYKLYKGCTKRKAKAQKILFEKHLITFLAISERYCSIEDAKDAVQESFITIYNKIDSFKWSNEKTFVAWMKKIVVNTSINFYHKKLKHSDIFVSNEDLEHEARGASYTIIESKELQPDHLLLESFKNEDVFHCIGLIQEPYKTAFQLYTGDGYSHKEIADILNISEKTSSTRVYRARKILQQELLQLLQEREVEYGE